MLSFYTPLAPVMAHLVHTVFETLAMMLGARFYLRLRRAESADVALLQGRNYAVLAGCLAGAALGNKLAFWFDEPQRWPADGTLQTFLLGGQSIVGGLLGGWWVLKSPSCSAKTDAPPAITLFIPSCWAS